MDTPQRANAAQMAARSIKAKPKGRTGGRAMAGPRPDSVPQFAQPSQNSGGLFGGSVKGTGSFDFSAPGGVSFPPSFGSNATPSPDVSDNEGRFAGDDRAMKRQFGGPSTMQQVQQPSPFGQSAPNPFGASAVQTGGSIFPFGGSSGTSFSNPNPGSAPASNPFSFGGNSQPVSASPSISFGSGAVENKPANSPFQFGQQNAQPQSFNSPFQFNSSASQQQPAAPQAQASTPVFNFGSPAPQNTPQPPVSKSPFTFGSTSTQEKPATTPFLFGQNPAPPATSAMTFGSKPATAPPMSNLFGTSTPQPAPPTNFFGTALQPSTNNLFGGLSAASPSTNSLFGSREPSPAPASNILFGGLAANTSSTSTEPPPTPNLFGEQKPQASTNIFGGFNKPAATNDMFSSQAKPSTPTNNLFGKPNLEQTGTKNLFGTLNKPVDESVKQHKADSAIVGGLNGNASANSTATVNSPFDKTPASTLFGQSLPSVSYLSVSPLFRLNAEEALSWTAPPLSTRAADVNVKSVFTNISKNHSNNSATNGDKPNLPFTATSTSLQHSPNLFSSPRKPIDAPMAASQPPPSGMFPRLPEPGKSPQKAIQSEQLADDSVSLSPIPPGHPALVYGPDPFHLTEEDIAGDMPNNIKDNPQAKHNWMTKYRIDAMNRAMSDMFDKASADLNPTILLHRYIKIRAKLVNENNAFQEQFKQSGTKDNYLLDVGSATPTPSKRKLVADEAPEKENPSKRAKEPSKQAQAPAIPELKNRANGIGGPEVSKLPAASPFKPSGLSQNGNSSSNLAIPSPAKNKRKAESQITKDTEEASPLRQIKTPRLNGATVGSNTSNIFKNILDSPSPSKSGSPTKPVSPVKKASSLPKDDTPKANPFGTLPVPTSPTKPAASPTPAATPSNTFTPKASSAASLFTTKTSTAQSNSFTPKATGATANPFSPKPAAAPNNNTASTTSGSTFKPPVFTSGPVDFLAQFGKKASDDQKSNEEDLLQKAIDADYDSDDDLEEFKENFRQKRKAQVKELEDLAKNTRNAFVLKANGGSASEALSKPAATTEAAPKPFFSQGATQGSGNSVFSSLNVSRTSTPGPFGSSTGSVLDGYASTKPFGGNIFGHLSDADSGKGNDADDESAEEDTDGDEENRDPNYQPGDDDASGHGTPASETGDGIASAKKSNFFSNYGTPKTSNLFGAPASSTLGGGLFGRIGGKETSAEKEQSGTTTPGGSLFDRIGSKEIPADKEQSGTTTPGGSLFDRITKDGNGNPVRHISTEEKENTQPSTTNIFKDVGSPFGNPFSKTPGVPADKTWKPDSPIRFGGAANTATSGSAPTVSITAATPTKTGSSSNLFGGPTSAPASNLFGSKDSKSTSSSAPFSNLFGNSNNTKGPSSTNVGFGFGAPSISSSLFPSAVVSANTSRATSPGATTDADSGVDGDHDAEVQEQINLTAGGPGEEDEEVLHEVRAKARMFGTIAGEDVNQWITKGVGPLRVLQNKDTKAVRILLRADPVGTIVLNKALLSEVKYESAAKTLKILANADDGKGLETWLLQVKTDEAAKELADILEKNKSS
ncbi:hypothetical protein IFR05_008152 [Cadophora sp. M221]|nr:hypothetical protein IFR05_008152 [Cadophora sp. M221]